MGFLLLSKKKKKKKPNKIQHLERVAAAGLFGKQRVTTGSSRGDLKKSARSPGLPLDSLEELSQRALVL